MRPMLTPVLGELEFSHTVAAGGAKTEVRVLIRSWFKAQAAHRFAGRGREQEGNQTRLWKTLKPGLSCAGLPYM